MRKIACPLSSIFRYDVATDSNDAGAVAAVGPVVGGMGDYGDGGECEGDKLGDSHIELVRDHTPHQPAREDRTAPLRAISGHEAPAQWSSIPCLEDDLTHAMSKLIGPVLRPICDTRALDEFTKLCDYMQCAL